MKNAFNNPALRTIATVSLVLFMAMPAQAQDREKRWVVTVGGGVQAYPKYPGADELGIRPMPIVDFRRKSAPLSFEAPDEGWGFGLLGDDSAFQIGPAIQFQSKRKEEDVGALVGDVGFTVEAGAFAEYFLVPELRVRTEVRKGLGGHEGWVGDLGFDYVIRDRDSYVLSIGPRLRWSDSRYQSAYFGLSPAAATATGLPSFDPDSGFHAAGIVAGLTYQFDRRWGLYSYAGYDRLIGNAADSPIVRTFGSRDQFSAGVGLSYSFGFDGF